MRNKLTLLLFILAAIAAAQSPKLINYQGVVRGTNGAPVPSQSIGLQFEVLQGSSTGSVVFTEQQTTSTNSLGLIVTQIGLNASLNNLSWKNGPYFLRVSADVNGGTSYVQLSTQQIVGVPYSFHASTVPASYTAATGVLDVGGNTFTLATTTLVAQGIATASTVTTNSIVLTVPSPTFTSNGPVTLTGAYPDYTVNAPPVTTMSASGIASVTSPGTNSFVVGVQSPTYTSNGPVSINGAYPNYTVVSPVTPTVSGTGIVGVTSPSTNSFVISVPQTSVTVTNTAGAGAVSTAGTNSFNINIPAGVTPSMTGLGAAVVNPATGNSFTVTVPQTSVTLTQTGTTSGIGATGTNSFNINVAPQVTPVITPGGAMTATNSGFNYSLSVPAVSITQNGAVQVTSAGVNNFTVNGIITQINGGGGITISNPTTNNFVLTVPPTTINPGGVVSVSGSANNFSVSVPGTSITASGVASVNATGTNSFNVTVPPTTINPQGVVSVSGSANNFSINVPGTSVTGSGIAAVNALGTNSFNVTVPPTTISPGGVVSVSGASNNFSISVPGTSVTGSGVAVVNATGTNSFNVTVPQSSVVVTSVAGAPGYTSTGTNSVTINIPPAITPTLSASGLASVTSSGNSFTVDVPVLSYTNTTSVLGSGTNTVNITPLLTLNQNTLSVGPTSNSVSLINISPWRQATGAVTLATSSDKVGIGTNAPAEALQIESGTNASVSIISGATNTSELLFGTSALHNRGRLRFDNSASALSLWTNQTSAAATFNSSGQFIVGANNPFASNSAVTISRNGAFNNQLMISGGDNTNSFGGIISLAENLNYAGGMSMKLDAVFNRLIFTNDLTGSSPVAAITGYGSTTGVVIGSGYAPATNPPADGLLVQGNTGIGTNNPGTRLEVNGDISIPNGNKIVFGTVSSGSGIGEWIQNSANGLQFNTASVPRLNITTGGNVGINTTTPITPLHVFGASTMEGNVAVGTSAASPSDLRVYGSVRMGKETTGSQGPNYPFGSNGLVIRRLYTTNITAGEIVAITDQLSFERDGTNGGFRITNSTGNGNEVCNCVGVNSSGLPVDKAFNNLSVGTTQVYTTADNVVFFHCMFGDPFNAGHTTEISFHRQFPDYFWMGTMTTTFNQ